MKINIVPEPQKTEFKSEKTVFTLTHLAEITADRKSEKAYRSLLRFIEKAYETEILGTGKESVELKVSLDIKEKEGYRLSVSENKVLIEGADESGVFWGVQTFCELLFENDRSLCELEIYDFPLFSKRAFMLDCSSWFFTTDAVKLFLDAMAMHKLNVFHWKLTGDAGWRLELYDNFLLSQIGGYRAFTGLGKVPHGGFYSRANTEEILAYAKERCITVVPEITVPDRTTAAISAYPFLTCFEKPTLVATDFKEKKTALCLGKESTYDFLSSVLSEVSSVFESGVVHLGGEKTEKADRSGCPYCEEKMRSLSLKSESGLYEYFLFRACETAKSFKMKPVLRFGELHVPDGVICDCESGVSAEKAKALSALWIDSRYNLSLSEKELSAESFYETKGENSAFGIQALLPTENVPSMKKAGELLFPRLGAFSELAWTKKENRSFERFVEKLNDYFRLVEFLPFDHAKKHGSNSLKRAAEKIQRWLKKQ